MKILTSRMPVRNIHYSALNYNIKQSITAHSNVSIYWLQIKIGKFQWHLPLSVLDSIKFFNYKSNERGDTKNKDRKIFSIIDKT